jgi:sigma-E factor negative regulatory protein RseA
MTNKIDEQLSTLVDDELTDHDAVLERVAADPELKARWSRYHLMRDVITGHIPDQPVGDIANRVSQALEQEPAIFAPVHKRKRDKKQLPFILKQVGGLAIAATVSAVAVLTVQQTQDETPAIPTEIAAVQQPQTQPQLQSQPAAQVRYVTDTSGLDTAVQSKLSGYLVNHNEYSVTGNMQGVLPYMRSVSETPGKVVVVRRANEQQ